MPATPGGEGELISATSSRYTKPNSPSNASGCNPMNRRRHPGASRPCRDDTTMQPLSDAATSRSEADWLVGINGTRAMTAFNSKTGGFHLTTVGRVQTPTLAILVDREERIKNSCRGIIGSCTPRSRAEAGAYDGRWFDEKFSRKEGDDQLKPERVWDLKFAEAIREKCLGKPGVVTEESKPTTSLSPQLYDLTSLQREANGRFGFSAKNTLGLAQALYEKHKSPDVSANGFTGVAGGYLRP